MEERASGIAVYVGQQGPIEVLDQDTLALLIGSLTDAMDWLIAKEGDTRSTKGRMVLSVVPPGQWYTITTERLTPDNQINAIQKSSNVWRG